MSQSKAYLGWKVDYLHPTGEAAFLAPDSVSWQVYKNSFALAIGGICAVLLEFADPRIRSGVWDHSIFKTDPLGRAQRTGIAAMVGVYGPQQAARKVIQGVNNMHAKVQGKTPAGEAYQATDPELLDWVSATARYGFVMAYDRFVRPLSAQDMAKYFDEGIAIAKLYGVVNHVGSVTSFNEMMMKLSPRFEPHDINFEFLDIMCSGRASAGIPTFVQRAIAHAAIDLLPQMVRDKLELGAKYDLTKPQRYVIKALGRVADHMPVLTSPAAHASQRLGLPRSFLWQSAKRRDKILARWQANRPAI